MNRNRIIKVILGVLTVLLVVWFCVLSYQDGYARDYGIYRSRTLLLMAVVLLLCCVVLFFVICAALLAWCMLSGQREEILSAYGLSREGILAGEYYRFFTCMFLHAGLLHLASNSIYLYYFGVRAERLLGTGKVLVL